MYYKLASKRSHFDVIFLFFIFCLVLTFTFVYLFIAGGANTSSASYLPEIKPPIENSLPVGLKLESSRRMLNGGPNEFSFELEIKNRFFSNTGPTSLYSLVDDVDARIKSINDRSVDGKPCLDMTPQNVNLTNWPSENIEMWFQCYEMLSPSGIMIMFGKKDDKVYFYEKGPVTSLAAIIQLQEDEEYVSEYPCCYQVNGGGSLCECVSGTCNGGDNCRTVDVNWPINDFVDAEVDVTVEEVNTDLAGIDLYYSVGRNWESNESGSRGLVHLRARPKEKRFEGSISGIGLGFCGVQFSSIGEKMKFIGSADGVGGTCLDVNHTCVSNDLETIHDMSECESISFTIAPLGRISTTDFLGNLNISAWDASTYPGLINEVSIADDNDSNVYFGPEELPSVLDGRNFGI